MRGFRFEKWLYTAVLLMAIAAFFPSGALALEQPGEVLTQSVGVFTELGKQVDLSREFTNSKGEKRSLSDFAPPGKPIIIAPVYFKCPRLCGLLLSGVYDLLNEIPLLLSADFSVLVVSFDPSEKPVDAKKVLEKFNARLIPDQAARSDAIQFLVGDESEVAGLMNDLDFKYMRDGEDFAHSSAIMILTPEGKISQYFTGVLFSPWDVRLTLGEASEGLIGSAIDNLLQYCFRFDPAKGGYSWTAAGLSGVAGFVAVLFFSGLILIRVRAARARKL